MALLRDLLAPGILVAVLALPSLSACGGGGGSGTPPTPPAMGDGGPGQTDSADASGPLPDASVDPTSFEGGSIAIQGCGYDVTTRKGASAPRPGEAILGSDPTPRRLHLGLAASPATSVVIQWSTEDETTRATTVQFGKAAVSEHEREGVTWLYLAGAGDTLPMERVHEAHICDLEPDTVYHYRVGGRGADGTEAWSAEHEFRTAPDITQDPSASVHVLVLGDSRNGYATLAHLLTVADGIGSPDLVLFTGDAVTHGGDETQWDAFFDAAEPLLERVPMLFAHGNHEQNSHHYYSLVSLPGDEENYSIDEGALHVVVLNDTPDEASVITGSTRDFLSADLDAHAEAPWTAVMHHRAIFSAAGHGGADDLRDAWVPVYDAHHVDLVLNGHNHLYERTVPMAAGSTAHPGQRGTVYVVAGAAGASLYNHEMAPWTAVSESVAHFVILEISRGRLVYRAYREDGSLLDQLDLVKP
jgi:hypothetical protein